VIDIYPYMISKFKEIVEGANLSKEHVIIRARILSPEEAIGSPKRKEFPLVKGNEKMIEAEFKNSFGQAFTDEPSNFRGTIEDILSLSLNNNKNRAILIATINAVLRYLNLISNTRHCKNDEPEICSEELAKYIKERYNAKRLGIIGFQPAFVDHLSKYFEVRVTDLNPENIGKIKYGVLIEDGHSLTKDIIDWADVILATGSSIVNATINEILSYGRGKNVIFYGVTIAGPAYLLNLDRWCSQSI